MIHKLKLPADFSWTRSILMACGLIWFYLAYFVFVATTHVEQLKAEGLVVAYSNEGKPAYISDKQMQQVYIEVAEYWKHTCSLNLVFKENAKGTPFSINWKKLVTSDSIDTAGRARAVHSMFGIYEAQIFLDSSGLIWNPSQVSLILAHEVGHMFGLEHTEQGLMAPVITSPFETLAAATTQCPNWKKLVSN